MKDFIKYLGFTTLSGVVFFVSVSGALLLADYWEKGSIRYPFSPPGTVIYDREQLGDLVIEKHSKVEVADKFTVRGMLRNTSKIYWHHVELELAIFAEKALLTTCSHHERLDQIIPGEVVAFQITCIKTQGKGLPENIRYEVYVKNAVNYNA